MLDWEENLFLGLKALHRRVVVRPRERRREAVRATLGERHGSLRLLASMVAGREVGILKTDDPRLCGRGRIFLPVEFSVADSRDSNAALFEMRTLIGALALREGWRLDGTPLPDLVGRCHAEFPGLASRIDLLRAALPPTLGLWDVLGALPVSFAEPPESMLAPPAEPVEGGAASVATEIEGMGQADVTVLPAKDDDGPGADLPMHTFEKVETLDEYNGMSRKTDDEDELEEHAEALSALKMNQVIRSPERPRSIYRADLVLDGMGMDVAGPAPSAGIPYPEWDWRRSEYRRDWCHVQEGVASAADDAWVDRTERQHRGLIRRMKRQFATLTSDWLRLRRQPAGSEFDIDALIGSEVERRTGHTLDERIYMERRRDLHDVAALLLLDASYSTDAWLDNRHVLGLIAETVFCVGEVLEDQVARIGIAAFSSNTRRSCRFEVLKPFERTWGRSRAHLGRLEPCGYTRIGPALRHSQECLLQQQASRKIVILVTDGRPSDYDRYEGRYGVEDVKKAVETGRLHGIQTHAFAIENQASREFPRMFTKGHFDILSRPDALAQTLCRLFARLLAG